MEVRQLKPGEAPPPRLTNSPYLIKLTRYVEICQQIRNGDAVDHVLTFGAADQELAKGRSPERIAGKVTERLKKQLERCYADGLIKDHNYQIYQNGPEVIVRKVADDNKDGFAHMERGKKAMSASRATGAKATSEIKPSSKKQLKNKVA